MEKTSVPENNGTKSEKKSKFLRFISRIKRLKDDEHGAIMIVAAISLVVFLSVSAFAVDLGLIYYQKSNLQNALDAAALAGAPYLPDQSRASAVALDYLQKNGFSAEDAVIEFPSEGVIRVSEDSSADTIFATLFNIKKVDYKAKAAAKFINKSVSLDFDYLMFSGSPTQPFNMYGHFSIYGSVFANSNINASPGSGSFIKGSAVSAGTCYINNSCEAGSKSSNVQQLNMPQWDGLIMTMVPTMDLSVFNGTYTNCSPVKSVYYPGDKTYTSNNNNGVFDGGVFGVYIGGNLVTTWGCPVTIWGDLYVEGDANIQGNFNVIGNMYVKGNLTRSSTYQMMVTDDLYVGGDLTARGELVVNKNVYVGGNFTKEGGTFNLTINKNVYTKGLLNWSTGVKTVKGGLYVYGQGSRDGTDVISLSGPITIGSNEYKGNVYCGNGGTNYKTKLDLTGQGGYRITGTVYSAGSIVTSQGGNGIEVDGCLIAERDVSIGGTTHTYTNVGTLSIYARHGNVTLMSAAGGFDLWGIIYAPEGNIALNSGGFDIYGNIVAQTITCNPGGLNLRENTRTLPYLKQMKVAQLVE